MVKIISLAFASQQQDSGLRAQRSPSPWLSGQSSAPPEEPGSPWARRRVGNAQANTPWQCPRNYHIVARIFIYHRVLEKLRGCGTALLPAPVPGCATAAREERVGDGYKRGPCRRAAWLSSEIKSSVTREQEAPGTRAKGTSPFRRGKAAGLRSRWGKGEEETRPCALNARTCSGALRDSGDAMGRCPCPHWCPSQEETFTGTSPPTSKQPELAPAAAGMRRVRKPPAETWLACNHHPREDEMLVGFWVLRCFPALPRPAERSSASPRGGGSGSALAITPTPRPLSEGLRTQRGGICSPRHPCV